MTTNRISHNDAMDHMMNPQPDIIECDHCHGFGSSWMDKGDTRCSVCGGTGLVRHDIARDDSALPNDAWDEDMSDVALEDYSLAYPVEKED